VTCERKRPSPETWRPRGTGPGYVAGFLRRPDSVPSACFHVTKLPFITETVSRQNRDRQNRERQKQENSDIGLRLANKIKDRVQGGHSPVTIKFPDFSRTFPDILREHRRSIAPRNSSHMTFIGNNFNYFPEN